MLQTEKKTWALVLLVGMLPPCLIGLMILKYAIDFPFSDQWEIVPLLVKKAQGTLTFSDLFAQVNEYRQFFPNLIFVYLGRLTNWDVRYEMLASFLTACAISRNVYLLGRKTFQGGGAGQMFAFLLSNLLIFSPAQYENWLMGQQLIFFIPILCITTCLLVSYSNLSAQIKFAVCALLSVVSSFSSANGLLCWIVVFPALAEFGIQGGLKKAKWPTAFWVAGFAGCVALYFYGFQRQPYLPSTSEAFAHPLSAVAYFLAWLGAPLTGNNRYLAPVAAVIGLVLTVLFISAWLFRVRYSGDRALKRSLTCWLMIGTYSFMTAGLVTLGRLGYGVNQSLSSRYTTFSLYLIVSLIHVGMIARGRSKAKLAKGTRLRATRPLIAATALVVLYMLASAISIRAIYQLHTRVMQEKACLLFVNVIAEACGPPDVTAVPDKLAERLNALDAMGFLRPGLVKSRSARDFAGGGKAGSSSGSFDRLSRNGGEFVAAGRAALPYRREPPDAVLLTYKTETGEAVLFSIAEMNYKGDILKRILARDADYAFRWQKTFSEESLPPDAVGVSAWAFDADTGKAYELDGEHTLR